MTEATITAEAALRTFGACIGVGGIVGLMVALFNSWTP